LQSPVESWSYLIFGNALLIPHQVEYGEEYSPGITTSSKKVTACQPTMLTDPYK
jgi:hypothetical protein